jgi:hypothetical protein
VGLALGGFLCWWRGRAFVPMAWPGGFDWERYLRETWAYTHPGTMVSTWLEPLYPWLLSTVGTELGWAWAGAVISSVAMLGIVLGAGLLGRALGDPWAGAVAAIAVPLTPQLVSGARWVNMYPLLAAGTAIGTAAAVAFARWPRWGWAGLAGLGIGLAWGVDTRTVTLIPGVVLLVLLGLQGVPGHVRKLLAASVFAIGLGLGPISQSHFRVIEREAAADVAVILRGIELSKIAQGQNHALRSACAGEPATVIDPAGLFRPCAGALAWDNTPRINENLPFGMALTMWLLPLAFLPGRGGRRRSVIAVLALVPALFTTWAMSRWIIITPRYLMQIAPLAAAVVPVALVQLVRTFLSPRWAWPIGVAGCVALGQWMWTGGPAERGVRTPLEYSSTYHMMQPIMERIRALESAGAHLLDCSHNHIEAALLPDTVHPPPRNHEGKEWERCAQWISAPDANQPVYVVTGTGTQVPGVDPHRLPRPWRRLLRSEGMGQSVSLWRWTDSP